MKIDSNLEKGNIDCIMEQDSRILTLGDVSAKIIPNMFIEENSVEARHGSIISSFNEEELFYLMSRGISKEEAMNLLVNCGCSIYCDGSHHWLAASEEKENKATLICPRKKDSSFEHTILIPPQDLYLFEPYITYIKL